jgi:hypothetical protein
MTASALPAIRTWPGFARRSCRSNPNDTLGILGCLQANRPKISRACQQVLASHGQ